MSDDIPCTFCGKTIHTGYIYRMEDGRIIAAYCNECYSKRSPEQVVLEVNDKRDQISY